MEARQVFGSSPVGPDSIEVTATKEEWREILEKNLWIPESALKEDDAFSRLVHWLINQGVYDN